MSTIPTIHWHEGLFLQPHHLQVLQRELSEVPGRVRRQSWAYPYGVAELRVSSDALETMLVRIDRLRAVMPSGLEIDVPGNTDLPALDIKRIFQGTGGGFKISLAVPLWQEGRANTVEPRSDGQSRTGDDARVKRLYKISEVSRSDENTGENAQPMLTRRYNARLVVDGEDTADMEVLPLLRVVQAQSDQTIPAEDKEFVPPAMVLSGSRELLRRVKDLVSKVEAARLELVNQMTRGGFVTENLRPPQMLQILRLRTLSRFAASLPTMVGGGVSGPATVSPLAVYLQLRELQGELAALSPDRDPFEAPKYDHDNLGLVFAELDRRIRPLLRGDVQKRFLEAPLVREGTGLGVALTDEHLTQPNGYYLGIKTKMEPAVLAKLVEDGDRFKFMSKSLVRTNLYGVKLQEDRHPPMELPSMNTLHYFRLNLAESERMWDRIKQEKAVGVKWPEGESFEFEEMRLYMTVP
jgi:type VI secretion system ImpJ/VasE family protein